MESTAGLRYPLVAGYRIGEEIGGGGFSKWVLLLLVLAVLSSSTRR